MTACLLGIDLGSGGCKVSLLDTHGHVVASAAREYATLRPAEGAAEQNPEDWWTAFVAALNEARACAPEIGKILGIAVVGVTHNAVLLGGNDDVLRPTMTLHDTRAQAEATALAAKADSVAITRTGNRIRVQWTLPQLAWLRKHAPTTIDRTRRIVFQKDYLRWRLTGEHATDRVDAIGSLLYDAHAGAWSTELCDLIGIDTALLPPVREPIDLAGTLSREAAEATGLPEGTPVVTGTTDTAAELLTAGCLEVGDNILKLATIGRVTAILDAPTADGMLTAYQVATGPTQWYVSSSTKNAASSLRWIRDLLFGDGGYAAIDAEVMGVPAGARGLIFHPYLAGEFSPHWDPELRGDLIGLSFRHGRAEIARGVMEGVAYSIRDAAQLLSERGSSFERARLIGGGAMSRVWPQILSDVLGCVLVVPEETDAAFGAAMIAAVGTGEYGSFAEAVSACTRIGRSIAPDPERHALYSDLYALYRGSQPSLRETSHRLGRWLQ